MKKKLILIILTVVLLIAFAGFSEAGSAAETSGDCVLTAQYHDNFNILQLTDIHWNISSPESSSMQYLDKLFKEVNDHIVSAQGASAKIDLVELTGDMFLQTNSVHLSAFIDYFEQKAEEYGFLYAPVWGNHDRYTLYNILELADRFMYAEHCMFCVSPDDLNARSNYIINLTEDGTKDTPVVWMIVNLDTGTSFSETDFTLLRNNDRIRPEQTDWFIEEHERAGAEVPAIAYYHIPQDENEKAWKAVAEDGADIKNRFFRLEEFNDSYDEKDASDFIDRAKDHNLKAAFMGHAHKDDWTAEFEGVVIGLGVKTGKEVYFAHIGADSEEEAVRSGLISTGITQDFDLIGASLVTITDREGSFDLEHLYFNERENGDFAAWVKW